MSIGDYLNKTERLFFLSPMVGSFQVRERQEQRQEGFTGVRAVLSHGDLLEAFEFIVAAPHEIQTRTYRIHWQSANGQLMRRWDNASHCPSIPNLPISWAYRPL